MWFSFQSVEAKTNKLSFCTWNTIKAYVPRFESRCKATTSLYGFNFWETLLCNVPVWHCILYAAKLDHKGLHKEQNIAEMLQRVNSFFSLNDTAVKMLHVHDLLR